MEMHRKALEGARIDDELRGCTFHPKIDSKSKSKSPKRTLNQFFEDMNNFLMKKEKHTQKLKAKLEEKEKLENSQRQPKVTKVHNFFLLFVKNLEKQTNYRTEGK